jgi:hypothetical protein
MAAEGDPVVLPSGRFYAPAAPGWRPPRLFFSTSVGRGHPKTTKASVARRVTRLFGNRAAARFFRWEMAPLTEAERAALPPPPRGRRHQRRQSATTGWRRW